MALPTSYDEVIATLAIIGDCDLSLEGNSIPGINNASPAQRDQLRTVFAKFHYFAVFLKSNSKALHTKPFVDTMADARICFVNETMSVASQPFHELEKKSSCSIDAVFASADALSCSYRWTSREGLPNDLLSPVGTYAIAFLGPVFSLPLLDLAFAFAIDYQSFATAWLCCPARIDHLDLPAVKARATTLRNSQLINSPGDAVLELVSKADTLLSDLIRSIYHAVSSRKIPAQLATVNCPFTSFNVTAVCKTEAPQYLDCAPAVGSKVQSVLPTTSSIPDMHPNFVDDRSNAWYRNNSFVFEHIKMPKASALRGDPLSELHWHKYKSDVIMARKNVPDLSERQVLQHLSASFSRSDQHYAVAQEAAATPQCTVKDWLDVISEFYFTGGQFRINIEKGWRAYAVAECPDFNELIHHIKTYYRLIYLDYAHLRGTLRKLDFAWILSNKLRDLINNPTVSTLAATLQEFMPYADLVEWSNGDLRDASKGLHADPDRTATKFITWVIIQLQNIRETANIALSARGSHVEQETRIDFAMLGAPKRQHRPNHRHYQQQAAAAAAGHPSQPSSLPATAANPPRHMQRPKRPAGSYQKVPNLKSMVNTPDAAAFTSWARELTSSAAANAAVKAFITTEMAANNSSLHQILRRATSALPNGLKPTFHSIGQAALKMHYLFGYKQCILCPNNRNSGDPARQCTLGSCQTLRALLPAEDHAALLADPGSFTRPTYPPVEGHTNSTEPHTGRQDSKRTRYDSDHKNPRSSRTQPASERQYHR